MSLVPSQERSISFVSFYCGDWFIFQNKPHPFKSSRAVVCLFSVPKLSLKSSYPVVYFFNMGLWNIKVEEGMARVYKDDSPLAKSDGQRYGIVTNVMCYYHAENEKHFIEVRLLLPFMHTHCKGHFLIHILTAPIPI